MYLDIAHRYYNKVDLKANEEAYMKFSFDLLVQDAEEISYALTTTPNGAEIDGTGFDVELDDLPQDCQMSLKYVLTDTEGSGVSDGVQLAVVAYLRAGAKGWRITNPKVTLSNLALEFSELLPYWISPSVLMDVEVSRMTGVEYSQWLSSVTPPPQPPPTPMGHPLDGQTVTIGVIAPTVEGFGDVFEIINSAENSINYAYGNLDYDVTFDFIVECAEDSPELHLEKVQYFNSMGVNLLIAGFWSVQASHSLDYVNENGMLMFSPLSTSSYLAYEGDNLFRLCPDDTKSIPAMVQMMHSMGIQRIIIIHSNQGYINEKIDALEACCPEIIQATVPYGEFDANILEQAEEEAIDAGFEGDETAGILLLSGTEWESVVNTVDPVSHPIIYSKTWFSHEGILFDTEMSEVDPVKCSDLRLLSPISTAERSLYWEWFLSNVLQGNEDIDNYFDACLYDIAWIYAKSILMAASTDTETIKYIIPWNSGQHFGASGNGELNLAGDRYSSNYEIWGHGLEEGVYGWYGYGYYDHHLECMVWYD